MNHAGWPRRGQFCAFGVSLVKKEIVMLMELEMEGASMIAFNTEADQFELFTNEQIERAFDKLEDAQDALWLKSVPIPEFDW